jgi:hypothetical protein
MTAIVRVSRFDPERALRWTALFFLAMTTLWPGSALANCHIFRVWHYPKPQRCFTAYAPARHVSRETARREAGFLPTNIQSISPERIDIMMPPLDFAPCPEGDERLQGIAKLHALYDAPRP